MKCNACDSTNVKVRKNGAVFLTDSGNALQCEIECLQCGLRHVVEYHDPFVYHFYREGE